MIQAVKDVVMRGNARNINETGAAGVNQAKNETK